MTSYSVEVPRSKFAFNNSIIISGLLLAPIMAIGISTYQQGWLTHEEWRAVLLSFFAGLSTSIGAIAAVVRQPNDSSLAFLLGLALGVMATLSVLELWLSNAMENGIIPVTVATLAGAALYYFVQPYFPEFEGHTHLDSPDSEEVCKKTDEDVVKAAPELNKSRKRQGDTGNLLQPQASIPQSPSSRSSIPPSELFRLGLLMALTMTLHNFPEGMAVAFSAYTDFGGIMAMAIAMHNIPEGIIVAAPIYAATGSRTQALLIAAASGLSEPVGALIALLFVKPFLTGTTLHYMLAFTGGIMLAVCIVELYPEAKKCKRDMQAWQGIAVGTVVMGLTLAADV